MMVFAVIFTAFLISSVSGGFLGLKTKGFPNVHCPDSSNSHVLLPCAQDCRNQHGAETGYCGDIRTGDFNCYCKGRSITKYNESLQCVRRDGDEERYHDLCTQDCQCNHGAASGFCDYENKACICEYCEAKNVNNLYCPFEDFRAFSRQIYKLLGTQGLGKFAHFFVNGEFNGL